MSLPAFRDSTVKVKLGHMVPRVPLPLVHRGESFPERQPRGDLDEVDAS